MHGGTVKLLSTYLSTLLYIVTRTHNCQWQFPITLTPTTVSRYVSAMLVTDTADCVTVQVSKL
jgi:hypothetical protein